MRADEIYGHGYSRMRVRQREDARSSHIPASHIPASKATPEYDASVIERMERVERMNHRRTVNRARRKIKGREADMQPENFGLMRRENRTGMFHGAAGSEALRRHYKWRARMRWAAYTVGIAAGTAAAWFWLVNPALRMAGL